MNRHPLTLREFMGEIAACCALLVFLFSLLIAGQALRPYEPSMHGEAALKQHSGSAADGYAWAR